MKARDHVTACVCTNTDGSTKLSMAIFGTAKNPRFFRLGTSPVPYLNQQNAWSDSYTFWMWFLDIFLPFLCNFTSRPCVLLMDNCGLHGADLLDIRCQVTLITLPPNCTSIHQPMDHKIIAAWKSLYRELSLRQIVSRIETWQLRRKSSTAKEEFEGCPMGLIHICWMYGSWFRRA